MNLRPELKDSASIIGGTQIQGRASLGGNICNAAPSADSVPLLIALGTTCNVQSINGERTIPLENLFSGPGQTVLEPNELLISITIPRKSDLAGANYIRFIPRNEMDIAVVGTGVSVVISDNKKNFESWVRIRQRMCEEAYLQYKEGTLYSKMIIKCSAKMNKTLLQKTRGLN